MLKYIFAILCLSAPLFADSLGGLTGETISIDRKIVSLGFDWGAQDYTVGTSTPVDLSQGFTDLLASATDTDLLLTSSSGLSGGPYALFDHIITFENLFNGTSQIITGFTFTDNYVFDPGQIKFTAHSVTIGIGNKAFGQDETLDIALQTSSALQSSSVPEPSGIALLSVAFGLLALIALRGRLSRRVSRSQLKEYRSNAALVAHALVRAASRLVSTPCP
ncbi:MAG TPA: hypothetical protein VGK64_11775 [Bryobacteraceae bacterium]